MDTRFNNLITPSLIRFIFIAAMIGIAIGLVIGIVAAFADSTGSGIAVLIFGPIGALLTLITVRMYLELIIVSFKIREAADVIASNTSRR